MTRIHWNGWVLFGLLALTPLAGCKQQLFLEPADYEDAKKAGVMAQLELASAEAIVPPTVQPGTAPATIIDPTRPPKYVTLKECVAIALEQGNVGLPAGVDPGITNNTLPQFTGNGSTGTDTIRAFALDPAVAAAEIERSLSKFDARWITSMTWQKQDNAVAINFQSLNNGDRATMSSTLAKPLPTGGTAGITFNTNYFHISNVTANAAFSVLPTSYTPQLQFTFEQPLLQGFGVEINELLTSHPGSQLIPGLRPSGGQGSPGILVARIRLDQQKAEFDRQVNNMLFNVEGAYWSLFGAYYNLYAQEEGLKQSYDAYLIIKSRAEGGVARPQAVEQYSAQVASFRASVLTARGQVLNTERNLRGLLGLRSDDGTRLVPIDDPTLVPYRPDYYELANEAVQFRPELLIARQELKAQQLNVVLQRNLRRPDLRWVSSYDIQGIGSRLDGPQGTNALTDFVDDRFNSWQVGLRLDMPIGFRDANALVRQAQLNMRKAYFQLTDAERKSIEFLTEQYRRVLESHEVIKYRRAQREALEIYVGKNIQVLNTGAVGQAEFEGFIGNLLSAQQNLANATAQEFNAIALYNTSLAGLEFAKGTIQRYNNVTVADGPLPAWVEKKAADQYAAREASIKIREHPAGTTAPPSLSQWQPLGSLPETPSRVIYPASAMPALSAPGTLPFAPINPASPALPMTTEPQPLTTPTLPNGTNPKVAFDTVPNVGTVGLPAAEATFQPIGTVTLPKRSRPVAGIASPESAPAPNPIPVAQPAGPATSPTVSAPPPMPGSGLGSSPVFNSPALR